MFQNYLQINLQWRQPALSLVWALLELRVQAWLRGGSRTLSPGLRSNLSQQLLGQVLEVHLLWRLLQPPGARLWPSQLHLQEPKVLYLNFVWPGQYSWWLYYLDNVLDELYNLDNVLDELYDLIIIFHYRTIWRICHYSWSFPWKTRNQSCLQKVSSIAWERPSQASCQEWRIERRSWDSTWELCSEVGQACTGKSWEVCQARPGGCQARPAAWQGSTILLSKERFV